MVENKSDLAHSQTKLIRALFLFYNIHVGLCLFDELEHRVTRVWQAEFVQQITRVAVAPDLVAVHQCLQDVELQCGEGRRVGRFVALFGEPERDRHHRADRWHVTEHLSARTSN